MAKRATTNSPMPKSSETPRLASTVFKVSADGDVTLSKRARQRRRQAQARRFAKALESTDGVNCKARSDIGRDLKPQLPLVDNLPKPTANEWIRVKRNRSTLHERIQRRRALLARARALVKEARTLKEEEVEKPPRQIWRPKSRTTDKAKASIQVQPMQVQPAQVNSTKNQPPRFIPPQTQLSPALTPKVSVFERIGLLKGEKSEAPAPLKRPRVTPTNNRLGLRIEVRGTAEMTRPQGQAWRRVTFGTNDEVPVPQKEIRSSKNSDLKKPYPHAMGCSSVHTDELYYRTAGTSKSRKRRSSPESKLHCPCSRMIEAVLSECKCDKETLQKASVFDRLGAKMPERESRHFRGRRARSKGKELLRVTANMTNKGSSTLPNPDASQRMTRLRSGILKRPNYSENEESDDDSAVASDNTVSSEGVPCEALMISTEQMAKMLEEALTKQKESFKFEMEMAVQQMREMHDQQIQALKEKMGESSHRDNPTRADNDSDASGDHDTHNLDSNTPPQSHPNESSAENDKIKELEGKINSIISAQEVKKTGIPCPYPRGWESIPYPAKFSLINFTPFDGKGSPTQHLIYFKSHLGIISGNEPLMVRSFVGTLRGAAFDWYRRLKPGSINSWDDMESLFLTNFFDDDTEISIGALLDEKQKGGETVESFVKRFRNKAMNCRDPISEEFILQTCHNNLSIEVLEAMGTAPSKTWKDLKVRGEQAERFLKRKKTERGQQAANTPRQNFVPQGRGKAQANAVDAKPTFQMQPQQHQRQGQQQPQQKAPQQSQHQWQRPPPKQMSQPRFPKTYAFKDDEVPGIFKYLLNNNKIQLPPIQNQEEAGMTTDPRYCAYHRAVHHPTKACYHLKDKIQALVDAGVITPK